MAEDNTVTVGQEAWQNLNNWYGYLTGDTPDNPSAGLVSEIRRRRESGDDPGAILDDVVTRLNEGRQAVMPGQPEPQ